MKNLHQFKRRYPPIASIFMSQLIVLERRGRKRYAWDPEQEISVEAARRIFESKLSEGYAAFKIFQERSGAAMQQQEIAEETVLGEQLHEFDSKARTIQMTPPMVGG